MRTARVSVSGSSIAAAPPALQFHAIRQIRTSVATMGAEGAGPIPRILPEDEPAPVVRSVRTASQNAAGGSEGSGIGRRLHMVPIRFTSLSGAFGIWDDRVVMAGAPLEGERSVTQSF